MGVRGGDVRGVEEYDAGEGAGVGEEVALRGERTSVVEFGEQRTGV